MLLSGQCSLILTQLVRRLFAICGRKSRRLKGLSLRVCSFFNLARPEIRMRKHRQVRRVFRVKGNRMFDEGNGLFWIAECGIWTVRVNTCRQVVRLGPPGFEGG